MNRIQTLIPPLVSLLLPLPKSYQQRSTYEPLDEHGPETWRRVVYHQNARSSVVELMAEFDQQECAFSAPKRARTTPPLQALTLLNHPFTIDLTGSFAERAPMGLLPPNRSSNSPTSEIRMRRTRNVFPKPFISPAFVRSAERF